MLAQKLKSEGVSNMLPVKSSKDVGEKEQKDSFAGLLKQALPSGNEGIAKKNSLKLGDELLKSGSKVDLKPKNNPKKDMTDELLKPDSKGLEKSSNTDFVAASLERNISKKDPKIRISQIDSILSTIPQKNLKSVIKVYKNTPILNVDAINDSSFTQKDLINTPFLKDMPVNIKNSTLDDIMKEAKKNLENRLKKRLTRMDDKGNKIEPNLPTTLKGLMQFAKQEGINISKMSLRNMANTSTKNMIIDNITNNTKRIIELEGIRRDVLNSEKSELLKTLELSKKTDVVSKVASKNIEGDFTLKDALKNSTANNGDEIKLSNENIKSSSAKNLLENSSEYEELKKKDELIDESFENNNEHLGDNNKVKSKMESMDYKSTEAKQMMKYLSDNLKEVIDNYKPPFMKMELKLNPEKLGDVDVTLIQRGNNVHINLSSNSVAINILNANSAEFKDQLVNSGLSNATMSFSGSDGGKNQEQSKNDNGSKYLLDDMEEDSSASLDIILPIYG